MEFLGIVEGVGKCRVYVHDGYIVVSGSDLLGSFAALVAAIDVDDADAGPLQTGSPPSTSSVMMVFSAGS